MDFGSPNLIKKGMLTEIKENQTAIIISPECGETMVVVNNLNKPYGAECHILSGDVYNLDRTYSKCKGAGFPDDFVVLGTAATGEVYISMECTKNTLPIAICVKEIIEDKEIHLKLCKVCVEDCRYEDKKEPDLNF